MCTLPEEILDKLIRKTMQALKVPSEYYTSSSSSSPSSSTSTTPNVMFFKRMELEVWFDKWQFHCNVGEYQILKATKHLFVTSSLSCTWCLQHPYQHVGMPTWQVATPSCNTNAPLRPPARHRRVGHQVEEDQ